MHPIWGLNTSPPDSTAHDVSISQWNRKPGTPGAGGCSAVERLPSLPSFDPGRDPGLGMESHIRLPARRLLLPLPLSLSVSLMNG